MVLSLCMPTNGVVQWVLPVLESIYNQGVDNDSFEVVITDNGDNQVFKDKIREYEKEHTNIVYAETKALPFINEIESYKRASGNLIKFVNHRTLLVDGTLKRLVEYAEKYKDERPITYFANGALNLSKSKHEFESFNDFVKNLSYWSSWSTGMTIWKKDFDEISGDASKFNELFPHTNVLFNERNRGKYVIDNTVIFDEMPQGKRPKGNYDLYYAFGVEYPRIITNLLQDGSIDEKTHRFVLEKNLEFIALLYWQYNIRKEYCSYNLDGLDYIYDKYYTKSGLMLKVTKCACKQMIKKIIGKI